MAGVALITPNHSHQPAPQFSYLGVPAPAGMGDWYEGMSRTPIRDECLPSRSWVSVAPARPVIPATHLVICMLQMPHEWAKLEV